MCASYSEFRRRALGYSSPKGVPADENHDSAKAELHVDLRSVTLVEDVRLRKLLQLMESNPLGNTRDWALIFNLSNSHLQRLFKRATGTGLRRALTEKRLLRAAALLSSTSMSIKEVAHAVGYEHTSSFTRAFERYFEEGPRDYRRRNAA
jgi:transcriptional regulator GlxA family with amidase domain